MPRIRCIVRPTWLRQHRIPDRRIASWPFFPSVNPSVQAAHAGAFVTKPDASGQSSRFSGPFNCVHFTVPDCYRTLIFTVRNPPACRFLFSLVFISYQRRISESGAEMTEQTRKKTRKKLTRKSPFTNTEVVELTSKRGLVYEMGDGTGVRVRSRGGRPSCSRSSGLRRGDGRERGAAAPVVILTGLTYDSTGAMAHA